MTLTSRVAEYNDLDGLERELAHGDVAAVLMEPALTTMGIVLPDPGYLEGVRELAPDVVTLGKAIGGGIPIGAHGLTDECRHRRRARRLPAPAPAQPRDLPDAVPQHGADVPGDH